MQNMHVNTICNTEWCAVKEEIVFICFHMVLSWNHTPVVQKLSLRTPPKQHLMCVYVH